MPAMTDEQDRGGVATLLAWWRELGVDGALDDIGTDWLAQDEAVPGQGFSLQKSEPLTDAPGPGPVTQAPLRTSQSIAAPAPISGQAPAREPPRRFPTAPPDAATVSAREAARGAKTLDELRAVLDTFDGCALKATAKSLCFYRGRADARLMIVGEAPGREEDLAGKPFVGRAGQLLDKMLAAIGLGEDDVHITNVVYWRPPGNRTPTPQEVQVCRPFLERQIELVAPDVLMTVGGPAAAALLGIEGGIMRARGRWREIEVAGRTVPAMPTLHPAYLLRTPIAKRLAWRDLLAIQDRLLGTRGT